MERKTVSPFHSFFISSDDCLFSRCQFSWSSSIPLGESWAEVALWLRCNENGLSGDGTDAGQMCPKAAAAMRQQPEMPFCHVDGRLKMNEGYGHRLSRGVQIDRVLIK